MMRKILAIIALCCINSEIVSAATNKVVCYHGVWSVYRSGNGRFTVDNIDPTLCTHLIYSFVGIQDDGNVKHLETNLDLNQGNIQRFNGLKQQNKNLKTLIAIGGWNEGSAKFSNVVASATKRATFIKSALNLVQTLGFDGFDLDWEYPAQRGGAAVDKQNFATLIKEFRSEFDKHGLLLTAAVAASSGSVDLSYDVPALSKYLDLINVMAYDFHGSWDGVTGQNAPLYPSSVDVTQNQKLLTVDAAIRGWIERGADPQKIALGLGVYGRSYTLANPSNNKVGAPVIGAGNLGKYTGEAGMLGYNEIVELISEGGWTTVWDEEQQNPYIYNGNQWIGYDDPRSIAIKVEYAKSLNLGAVMIWSIETEDFRGVSGTKYPILRAINQALGDISNGNAAPEPAPAPAPAPEPAPEPVPVPDPNPGSASASGPEQAPSEDLPVSTGNVCTEVGYVRDPNNCSVFYYCLLHNAEFIPLEQRCSSGLVFDQAKLVCNYPNLVQC